MDAKVLCMKVSATPRSAPLVAVLAATVCVLVTGAQAPQGPAEAGPSHHDATEAFPAPVNLKVLPGDLTGRQVHDLMKQWSGELGVRCVACHVQDSDSAVTGGFSPRFADDSKPMKETARRMYTMTQAINNGYIAKVEGSGMPVTCGTCHRGNVSPEPFADTPVAPHPPSQTPAQTSRPPAQ